MSAQAPAEPMTMSWRQELSGNQSGTESHVLNRRNRMPAKGKVGLVMTFAILAFGLVGPVLISADPFQQDLSSRFQAPVWTSHEWSHPLGTDQLGRDLLARSAAGTRASLEIGFVVTGVTMLGGVALGLLGGIRGGAVDRLIGFIVDVQLAIPVIVLAIAMSALFDPGIPVVIVVLSTVGWITYQRVTRDRARALRSAGFVEASRCMGASRFWIARHHLLPNLFNPVIVLATQQLAAVILFEAALSYLGLGVPPSTITLGGMVANGREAMLSAWWVVGIPGAIVAVFATGWLLFGEGMRQRLDPTLKQ